MEKKSKVESQKLKGESPSRAQLGYGANIFAEAHGLYRESRLESTRWRVGWLVPAGGDALGCTRDARAPQKNADGSESSSLPKIGECLRKSAGNLIKRLEARFYFGGMHSGGGASPERFTVATLIDSRV